MSPPTRMITGAMVMVLVAMPSRAGSAPLPEDIAVCLRLWHYRCSPSPDKLVIDGLIAHFQASPEDRDTQFWVLVTEKAGLSNALSEEEEQLLLRELEAAGHPAARSLSARLILESPDGDAKHAMSLLIQSFNDGDPDAAYLLGEVYHTRPEVKDLAKAQVLLEEAVARGKVRAWSALAATWHELGDTPRALHCGLAGANAGDPVCLFIIARKARDGDGTDRDVPLARKLFEDAARRGLVAADAEWEKLRAAEREVGLAATAPTSRKSTTQEGD